MEKRGRTTRHLVNFQPRLRKTAVYVFNGEGTVKMGDLFNEREDRIFYQFELTYQSPGMEYNWTLNKTYDDIRAVAQALAPELLSLKIESQARLIDQSKFLHLSPALKLQTLEEYLQALLSDRAICHLPCLLEFLEVCPFSFDGTSSKHKEGYIYKRTGGRPANEGRTCNCSKYFRRYQRRWFIIRDTMVGYLTSHTSETLHESLLFKGKFLIQVGVKGTGFRDGVKIETSQRVLVLRAGSEIKMWEWQDALIQAYQLSEWSSPDFLYGSSFPVRGENQVQWYVDGEDYYSAVYTALINTQREVFISDWWLSPELHLLRPASAHPESELVEVLGTLADKGIAVHVCVYKEVKFALTLSSLHTKEKLLSRSAHIKIVRHPHRSVVGGEFLWSHHEKVVCIDQQLAFLGGFDLCFGRWDKRSHPLFDSPDQLWPGIDFSNCRISDFTDVHNWERDSINRSKVPRMPWHDVGVRVVGKAAGDVALHFIELWNHVMTDITGGYYKTKVLLQPGAVEPERPQFLPILEVLEPVSSPPKPSPFEVVSEPASPVMDSRQRSRSLFFRQNSIRKITTIRQTIGVPDKRIDVTTMSTLKNERHEDRALHISVVSLDSRMKGSGIEDGGLKRGNITVVGDRILDEKELEIQRILRVKSEVEKPINRQMTEEDHERMEADDEEREKQAILQDEEQGDEQFARNLLQLTVKSDAASGTCECQLVRSGGRWSLGLDEPDVSIHTAYLHLIDRADHFIYIENQFFISSTADSPVQNQIAQALVERIKVAAEKKEPFKVIVVLPLVPAFEGSVDDSAAAVLRVELHWQYKTIARGVRSLLQQLKADPNVGDPEKYISFYGLRTHGTAEDGSPATEIVYVHSKVMIVDDEYVLIGSANINDRSLVGRSDSELALVIHDASKTLSRLNDSPKEVSTFAYSLRISLFSEHTGCHDPTLLQDPLSAAFDSLWRTTAKHNTDFYRRVFQCYPDDNMQRITDVSALERTARIDTYDPKEPCGTLVRDIDRLNSRCSSCLKKTLSCRCSARNTTYQRKISCSED